MTGKIQYDFSAKIWMHNGTSAWYFISLPLDTSSEIREHSKWMEEGWGRLKIVAQIGQTKWDTAIWFDTKQTTYLLPIKSDIRRKEKLKADDVVAISIWV